MLFQHNRKNALHNKASFHEFPVHMLQRNIRTAVAGEEKIILFNCLCVRAVVRYCLIQAGGLYLGTVCCILMKGGAESGAKF